MSSLKQRVSDSTDQKRKKQRKDYDGFDFEWYFGSAA
jgi:hypothetical protein